MVYKAIAADTRILLDYEGGVIHVSVLKSLLAGFKPQWEEMGTFTEEQWQKSCYASMVVDPDMEEGIIYFWTDLEDKVS